MWWKLGKSKNADCMLSPRISLTNPETEISSLLSIKHFLAISFSHKMSKSFCKQFTFYLCFILWSFEKYLAPKRFGLSLLNSLSIWVNINLWSAANVVCILDTLRYTVFENQECLFILYTYQFSGPSFLLIWRQKQGQWCLEYTIYHICL